MTSQASTTTETPGTDLFRRGGPVLLLIVVELAWSVYLASSRTIPGGHDGFQYFYLKYYFFNDFVLNGERTEWLPYLTHGSPSAWWYVVQSGIFDPVMLLVARFLQFANFLPIFYALLFFEKLLLILGSWLFAGEHLRSRPARFAVTAAVSSTCIWYTQPWWDFHAVVALPMMLFFLHRTLFAFRWQWPIGLSVLLYLQTFGHLSYYLPITLLLLAAYAGPVIAQRSARSAFREQFRFSAAGLLILVVVNIAFLFELVWLQRSSQEIAFASSQRGASGAVPLNVFLNYAGNTDLRAWNQFFTGLTPHLDFTLFAGFLTVGLAVVALSSGPLNHTQRLFAWLTALMLLMASASPVATIFFYVWPLGRLFRHLALLVPAAKFFCIFLAGATLDRLVCEPGMRKWRGRTRIAVTVVLASVLMLLVTFAIDPASLRSFLAALEGGPLPVLESYGTAMIDARLLRGGAFLALTWIVLLALGRMCAQSDARASHLAWIAGLVLFFDVSTYGWLEMRSRTLTLPPREAAIFQFTDRPYIDKRSETAETMDNARRRTFSKSLAQVVGTRYWPENLLWLTDTYRTSERTGFWSTAFDSLLQAMEKRDGSTGAMVKNELLVLPTDDGLLTAIAGFRESKIRFLARAIVCPDTDSTTELLANPAYHGQAALLTGDLSDQSLRLAVSPCEPGALTASDAPSASTPTARNSSFSSNQAEFDVENPTSASFVMTYSDTWSDHWRARINNKDAQVLRSDLAYKAVVIPPGRVRVQFQYRDRWAEIVFASQALASVGFVLFLAFLIVRRVL